MAYDRAITVFSPDGRLFQVEYAREAVKRGTTTVGLKYDKGVVLIIDKRITSNLIEPHSIEKMFQIDNTVGCATSGLVADARVLVERARVVCQVNKIRYNEEIPVEMLVKEICDFKQSYTQYGGVRPFGIALLIGGVDPDGTVHLYETDPSGAMMAYKAGSIGAARNNVLAIFEEKYKDGMSRDDAIMLGLGALKESTEAEMNAEAVEIGLVEVDGEFRKITNGEVQTYLDRL